jgi:hypothetical protein
MYNLVFVAGRASAAASNPTSANCCMALHWLAQNARLNMGTTWCLSECTNENENENEQPHVAQLAPLLELVQQPG